MPFVYIIYSASLDRYYVGLTTASPQERLKKHNDAAYGSKHFTSSASDWILKLEIECDNNSIARKAEIYIKRMKSRKFIERFGNGVVWFKIILTGIAPIFALSLYAPPNGNVIKLRVIERA